jgi:hypothetical protein
MRNCDSCVNVKPTVLTATEAARGFGDLLARVRYRREAFLIRRGGTIVARLGPVDAPGVTGAQAAAAWDRHPRLNAREAQAFARELESARKQANRPPRDPWAR